MDINVKVALEKSGTFIFFLILESIRVDGAMFCYHGNDVKTLSALKNETCLTKELHIPKMLVANDQQTSATPVDFEETKGKTDSQSSIYWSQKHTAPYCYIFRHISTAIYPGLKQQSEHVAFGCDFGHLCSNKELKKVLRNATRQNSQLYCCNSENCNTVDRLPHLAAKNQLCYQGTNNASDSSYSPTAMVQSCSQPDVPCVRKTTFLPQGKIEDYYCDNDKYCSEQMMLGAYRSCTNTTVDNSTQELCCCNKNKCFVPEWLEQRANNTIGPINVPPFEPIGATIHKPRKKKTTSAALITGLVAAIVVIAGFAAGIVFITACKRRKRRRRDPNVIMQYERLSVSDGEVEDAVVL